jgi:hypothetical protein
MNRLIASFLIVTASAVPLAARADAPVTALASPCRADDRKCALEAASRSPVKRIDYWKSAFERPVEQRVGTAPRELVEYLILDNISQGFPNQPRQPRSPRISSKT